MKNLAFHADHLYKKIDYQLKLVNLSVEIILGLKRRKVYKLLKRANRISEQFNFTKAELKELSGLIAAGALRRKKAITKIARLFFKNTSPAKKGFVTSFILLVLNAVYLEPFFNKKQIIRC